MSSPAEADNLIFVVDDDRMLCMFMERWLTQAGFEVSTFSDGAECLEALSEELPSAICLDLNMPGMGGIQTLEEIRRRNPLLPVIVLTADDTVDSAVRAMKAGARDYLTKPLDRTKVVTTLQNAVEHGQLTMRVTQLERELEGNGYPGIVGASPAMKTVFRQLDRLAKSDVTVLIHGESGTGKELIAHALHNSGGRARSPFVAVNSAAIPESLMESELFGHEKGAFTGAVNRRIGRFEEADKGTLFLDEIGELSANVQAKLLRVLQERTFQRVGGTALLSSNFRLISATHRRLGDEVKAGRFREDLYFRLAVFELDLPPLRKRREDIPLLVTAFLKQLQAPGGALKGVSTGAMQMLTEYPWPGNVRELQNVVQRAVVLADGDEIRPAHLPERLTGRQTGLDDDDLDDGATLEDASKRLLLAAMAKHGGNASAVMRELKIGRTRFYRMLKKFELTDKMGEIRQTR